MTTSITSLPGASLPLTGAERLPMDQTVGSAIAASALVVGTGYRIETVGTTNWTACGLPAGVTAAVGLTFVATAAGTGTGTAIEAETREATAAAIAALAPPTNLSYDEATRLLSSSTGTDVTLSLATDALPGLMAAGDKARIDQLGADDSPSFTGLTITGTAAVTIPHIHGDLAGAVYIHVKNTTAGTLAKGFPVYPTGTVGDTTTLEVAGADSNNANLLPAVGLLADALAPNASGHAVIAGELTGLNTAGYAIGDALYVASGGGLTATRPTTGTIQQVAIVGRVNSGTGSATVTISTEISPNWDTAYSQRLRWDGGATGLNAVTGRASLELAAVASTGAYGDLSGRPTLGTAAAANTGTGAGNVVVLDGSARLPAVDGSQLTGLSSAPVTSVAGRTGAIVLAVGDVANAVATNDARLSDARTPLAHNQAWSTITETPTTLAGYGITDALSTTTTRAANLVFAGPTSGAAAAPTFRALVAADLPAVAYSQHSTITASGSPSTYTLDAAAYNEFSASAAVAGNVTITASNLASVPSGQVWRAVFRFAYTSGAITLAAPAGATVKGSLGTLTAGQTYDLVVRFIGGGTVLDYRLGGGFAT